MSRKPLNFVRRYRKRYGLTQREVAFLMGCKRSDKVSDHERRLFQPNLRNAFAYQVLYGVPAHKLFPQVYEEVEESLQKRAILLSKQIEATKKSARLETKKKRLAEVASLRAGEPAQAV